MAGVTAVLEMMVVVRALSLCDSENSTDTIVQKALSLRYSEDSIDMM